MPRGQGFLLAHRFVGLTTEFLGRARGAQMHQVVELVGTATVVTATFLDASDICAVIEYISGREVRVLNRIVVRRLGQVVLRRARHTQREHVHVRQVLAINPRLVCVWRAGQPGRTSFIQAEMT